MTQITTNAKYSILCDPRYGPTFGGGHDLRISDKSNNSNISYGNIGYSFNNGTLTYGTQQTYTAWTGQTSGCNFSTE